MLLRYSIFFFFNDTATTEIYTLSLHDALPILLVHSLEEAIDLSNLYAPEHLILGFDKWEDVVEKVVNAGSVRSEEHTSELQSRQYLVCRLLLEKKKKN